MPGGGKFKALQHLLLLVLDKDSRCKAHLLRNIKHGAETAAYAAFLNKKQAKVSICRNSAHFSKMFKAALQSKQAGMLQKFNSCSF
jgi:hypothetical protein